MHVTILADASHCPDTKAGGYGFWIASQRGKKGGSGQFKGRVATSTLAEMMALANSLYEAVKSCLVIENDIVLFQTDCEAAIFGFIKKRKVSKEELITVTYIDKLSKNLKLKIHFKHVKGHSNSSEARFAANNACDRAARKAMRKARNSIRLSDAKLLLERARVKNETIS